MTTERKWLYLRAAVWTAIVVYAVMVMRDPHLGDGVGRAVLESAGIVEAPVVWVDLPRTGTPARPAGDVADAVAAWRARTDDACPHPGTLLRVRLGPNGLVSASAAGPAASQPCFAALVWAAPWPAVEGTTELELGG